MWTEAVPPSIQQVRARHKTRVVRRLANWYVGSTPASGVERVRSKLAGRKEHNVRNQK